MVCLTTLLGLAVLLSGCAEQQVVDPPDPIAVASMDKAKAMALSEDVLARLHFAIEKADMDLGVLRTAPLTGSQFFEFWRKDSVGSFNKAESNLQNIRRVVEVRVSEANGGVRIDCRTNVQRLSIIENELSSSARAYQMHTRSSQDLQRLQLGDAQVERMAWIDLGPDNELAAEVLKRIESRIAEDQGGQAG